MKREDLLKKERRMSVAALALDRRLAELEEERLKRLGRIISDVNWLKSKYACQFESVSKRRSAIFSELYQLREKLSAGKAG